MIERKIGLVFVPTKIDDIIKLKDGSDVENSTNHTIVRHTYKKIGRKRTLKCPTWHFYEEINLKNQPWHGLIRFQRREKDNVGNKTPRPYQVVKF